jgi:hypothetical protein
MTETEPLTPKEQRFCELFATPDERGRNRTAAEAYGLAYDSENRDLWRRRAYELRQKPRIKAEIERIQTEVAEELEERVRGGIAKKANRLLAKQRRHDLLVDLLEARQAGLPEIRRRIENLENELLNTDDEAKQAAIELQLNGLYSQIGIGEETGLLARDVKGVCETKVDVFRLDKPLLDALNDLENDVAKELGQLATKIDVSMLDDATILRLLDSAPKRGG